MTHLCLKFPMQLREQSCVRFSSLFHHCKKTTTEACHALDTENQSSFYTASRLCRDCVTSWYKDPLMSSNSKVNLCHHCSVQQRILSGRRQKVSIHFLAFKCDLLSFRVLHHYFKGNIKQITLNFHSWLLEDDVYIIPYVTFHFWLYLNAFGWASKNASTLKLFKLGPSSS